MGKIIVIEGTDCSGKETQSKMLFERLEKENIRVATMSFPVYDSPTGKIVGGAYLGKDYIYKSWFPEGAPNVDWKVSSLLYGADRRYHLEELLKKMRENDVVILDRYTFSNMGYQAAKLETKEEREEAFNWIEHLEFDMLELPRPDVLIFLHMPLEYQNIIKSRRPESLDGLEIDAKMQLKAYKTYMELIKIYNGIKLECVENEKIKSRKQMHEEVYEAVHKLILK